MYDRGSSITRPSPDSTRHGPPSWESLLSDPPRTGIWDSPISTALQSPVEDGRRPLKTSKPGTSMLEPRSPHIGTSGIGDTEVPSWNTWPRVPRADVMVSMLPVSNGSRSPRPDGMEESLRPRLSLEPRPGLSTFQPRSRLVPTSSDTRSLPCTIPMTLKSTLTVSKPTSNRPETSFLPIPSLSLPHTISTTTLEHSTSTTATTSTHSDLPDQQSGTVPAVKLLHPLLLHPAPSMTLPPPLPVLLLLLPKMLLGLPVRR